MPDTSYRSEVAGGVPVVTAPAEIDIATAAQLRAVLFGWRARGHVTVVVDLAGTQFCDSSGLRELARAHQRARAEGGGLRLVTPADGAVPRVFSLTGLDRLIPCFASRAQAVARLPGAAARRPPGLRFGSAVTSATSPRPGEPGVADERRGCEQCGAMFAPQREHSRFCTARCRAAWNREHLGDPADEASALTWSVTAMSEATARLAGVSARERPRGLTPIEEAVWWITMVDATLVRHHPAVYDAVLAAQAGAEGRLIKETLAGLRFVRNWIGRGAGLGEIIETGRPGAGNGPITSWTWKPVPGQALASLPPRGQAWEMSRYRAYQARLASRTIGETIGRAVTFLAFTGANVASSTDAGQRAARS